MAGTETRSLLDAARELAPKIRAAADEIEAERELPRALFEALADAGFYHMAVPRSLGGARGRPADLYPGPRGAGQGGREHRVDDQPGRDLCDVRGAHAARQAARDLDRHAARRRLEHARPDGDRGRRARRVPRHGPPGLQHRLPARVVGRRARAGRSTTAQVRIDPANGQPEARYLYVPVGGGGAARHVACAGHARHRHASLRGERRVRAPPSARSCRSRRRSTRPARSTRFPARSCSRRATPSVAFGMARTASKRSSSWRARRRRARCPGSCASSRWRRSTWDTPRPTCAPAARS